VPTADPRASSTERWCRAFSRHARSAPRSRRPRSTAGSRRACRSRAISSSTSPRIARRSCRAISPRDVDEDEMRLAERAPARSPPPRSALRAGPRRARTASARWQAALLKWAASISARCARRGGARLPTTPSALALADIVALADGRHEHLGVALGRLGWARALNAHRYWATHALIPPVSRADWPKLSPSGASSRPRAAMR